MTSVSVLVFTKAIKMLKSAIVLSLFQVSGKTLLQKYLYMHRFHRNVVGKIALHSFNFYKTLPEGKLHKFTSMLAFLN